MKKRVALLLLTSLCLVNTMPGFAAQSAKISVVGSAGAEYAALPDGETLKKDVGFKPKAVAALAGGYQFEEGHILYIIMDINKKVTKEELAAMAKELVDLETDTVDIK